MFHAAKGDPPMRPLRCGSAELQSVVPDRIGGVVQLLRNEEFRVFLGDVLEKLRVVIIEERGAQPFRLAVDDIEDAHLLLGREPEITLKAQWDVALAHHLEPVLAVDPRHDATVRTRRLKNLEDGKGAISWSRWMQTPSAARPAAEIEGEWNGRRPWLFDVEAELLGVTAVAWALVAWLRSLVQDVGEAHRPEILGR